MAQFDRLRASLPLHGHAARRRQPANAKARAQAARDAAAAPDPVKEHLATEGVALTRAVITKALTFGVCRPRRR